MRYDKTHVFVNHVRVNPIFKYTFLGNTALSSAAHTPFEVYPGFINKADNHKLFCPDNLVTV